MAPVYVFDAYGTLFDVHAAIARHRAVAGPDADRFSEIWRTKQLEYAWTSTLAGDYADFWTLTEHALDYAFASRAERSAGSCDKLLDAYLDARCFCRRARRADTASRSVASASQFSPTAHRICSTPRCKSAGIAALCDAVLSVDAVRMYKPRPEVYALVTAHFGVKPQDVVFVSSNRWDVMGAAAFGFRAGLGQSFAEMPDEYPDQPPCTGRGRSIGNFRL